MFGAMGRHLMRGWLEMVRSSMRVLLIFFRALEAVAPALASTSPSTRRHRAC